jgi:NAD(P)-dependent dehydrogenase (short-subunit alcohol dehydrogenase family)
VRLQGKAAFVTGAGGGIGRAICAAFLAQGARVAATDLDAAAAADAVRDADEGQAIALACDAGDGDQVRTAIAAAVDAFGRLDVLCAVAGGSSSRDAAVTDAPEDEFWRVIRTDLFGPFLVCKHGIPELVRAGGGSVVLMTSMAALTRSVATGYGAQGIRVNAIAPGMTMTPRVAARLDNPVIQELAARHLLGPAEPRDVADMAVFLASDESRRVTGQVLPVDSGVTIH